MSARDTKISEESSVLNQKYPSVKKFEILFLLCLYLVIVVGLTLLLLASRSDLIPLIRSVLIRLYRNWEISKRPSRRPLRRVPRPTFPGSAGRARWRVLHARRVEGHSPSSLVILGQLAVKALAVHAHGDVADAGPGPGGTAARCVAYSRVR